MNEFFRDNHKLVFQEWIAPEELPGASVLDLGSQTGWLGEYCLEHGASEYVGVEINKFHVDEAVANYPELTFFHMDLEEYVANAVKENKKFDITVISRTIHGVLNQTTLLQNLSKISNKVIIESGVPVDPPAYKLLRLLKNIDLTEEQKSLIEEVKNFIEYDYPYIEYLLDDRFMQLIPSIGFFKEVFDRLGFEMSLTTYKEVKEKYPIEYGFDIGPVEDQKIKRCILKFTKVTDVSKPLSWKQWDDVKDK